MKKSTTAIIASLITMLSGCSIYTAPWDDSAYNKAPVVKEAKVYQPTAPSVNTSSEKKAPVLDTRTNTNVVRKEVKPATVLKEKVVEVPVSSKNSVPKVSEHVKIVEKPVEKNVLLIPIE